MRRVAALAAFQVLVILGWASYEERVRATAPTFRIPLRRSHPLEVLRWRGLAAHPLDAEIDPAAADAVLTPEEVARFLGAAKRFAGPALVGFCPRGEAERVCALAPLGAPVAVGPARHWARAHVRIDDMPVTGQRAGGPVHINLRLDWLLLPLPLPGDASGAGWELEVSDRPGQPLLPLRLWFRGRPLHLG